MRRCGNGLVILTILFLPQAIIKIINSLLIRVRASLFILCQMVFQSLNSIRCLMMSF